MKKRQVKKFAKNAKKNMTPYRQAARRGSKKLTRRHRAFGRYWPGGLSFWDAHRIAHIVTLKQPRSWSEITDQLTLLNGLVDAMSKGHTHVQIVRVTDRG